jgi:two-component system chemotaxis sensor kinase CheA
MNLDDALQTFIIEARELLEQMEESLLRLEQLPDDADSINAIFRAAHTIKGSSGLFGLDFVVKFTHVAESVLDKVRSREITVDEKVIALFLEIRDHLSTLVDLVQAGQEPDGAVNERSDLLTADLNGYLSTPATAKPSVQSSKTPQAEQASTNINDAEAINNEAWHVSVQFGVDIFRNGMDPFSFVRYMNTIGEVKSVTCIWSDLPTLDKLDAENCHTNLEISFNSDASKAEIEAVFDFVKDDCTLNIIPPHSKIDDFIKLIQSQPDSEQLLGEILVGCGALTPQELQSVLQKQALSQASERSPLGEVILAENLSEPAVIAAALDKQKNNAKGGNEASLIRVDAQKLDKLIDMVGELIIAGASVSAIAQQQNSAVMLEATSEISRLVEEVRDSALSLRMVQIGATFSRFNRVVRDVSKDLGKDIRLEISGEETELDKTVVEKISDPLTHLVRNSMDHGIEPADVRIARGKPAHGTLKLNAYHDAGNIIIEVIDDGGGLNKEKILKKAIERGLVSENHNLSDKEIYNLIFEAGFSTADAVSNLSGRGVGMDVVRRNIQALRGTIEIHSEPGLGSTMRIRLPLTLAIIDGFLVGVGNSTYVIPLDMVIECIELGAWSQENTEGEYLNLRGEVLPYSRLRDHFEIAGEPAKRENVVVVRFGDAKVGLVVDKLMGEFQTVIKPLGKMFSQISGIGGFTILGTGEVALILDVPGLMRQLVTNDEPEKQVVAVR